MAVGGSQGVHPLAEGTSRHQQPPVSAALLTAVAEASVLIMHPSELSIGLMLSGERGTTARKGTSLLRAGRGTTARKGTCLPHAGRGMTVQKGTSPLRAGSATTAQMKTSPLREGSDRTARTSPLPAGSGRIARTSPLPAGSATTAQTGTSPLPGRSKQVPRRALLWSQRCRMVLRQA